MQQLLPFLLVPFLLTAQEGIPFSIHPELKRDAAQNFYMEIDGNRFSETFKKAPYTLKDLQGNPQGTATGIALNFEPALKTGTLYFGLIPYGETNHPQPVYFKTGLPITAGKVHIPIIGNLEGRYDMVNWEANQSGVIGFRVTDERGDFLYDGRVHFEGTGPFSVGPTIVEGPFINCITPNSAVIAFVSLTAADTFQLEVAGQQHVFFGKNRHEIRLTDLNPATSYNYLLKAGNHKQQHSFNTAPPNGAAAPFTFAYASDSRKSTGGGERNIYGTNAYIMKKLAALAVYKGAAFFQFSGDLVDGYVTDPEEMHLQLANWKRAIEPFSHGLPWYVAFGNHESLSRNFVGPEGKLLSIDRFPYATESGEVVFAQNFVNPTNGPFSEDGASYDPNPNKIDFPPYNETVFHYQHGNTAVVVLNSNYWYAVNKKMVQKTSGDLHGYIMDQQLAWFKNTIATLEKDPTVTHIFVTLHTPFFPNGGHVKDDMWYHGNNSYRSVVSGKPLKKGIIERRDELLDIITNQSSKTIAILTGDEHNYAKTEITPELNTYPDDWKGKKLQRSRTIWQINNGAAGAPYYAQELTPWTPNVTGFSTQNALVLFHISGHQIEMEVISPDTLEKLDAVQLR